ncbi:hypothetical protein PROFUN_14694 [Planoprotostelium fungivorum]|uniref:Uncharacterized protein n=1 Tax=Planoprotostelium fungivorum TaxID=1890364 RepID=A0A2P6MZ77_9EUKA|nr:hypothetical protein PROFUN_14694 [Planoprotostelium fungivorum]
MRNPMGKAFIEIGPFTFPRFERCKTLPPDDLGAFLAGIRDLTGMQWAQAQVQTVYSFELTQQTCSLFCNEMFNRISLKVHVGKLDWGKPLQASNLSSIINVDLLDGVDLIVGCDIIYCHPAVELLFQTMKEIGQLPHALPKLYFLVVWDRLFKNPESNLYEASERHGFHLQSEQDIQDRRVALFVRVNTSANRGDPYALQC